MATPPSAVDQLTVSNVHTSRYQTLYKSYLRRKNGESATEYWDYLRPELQYDDIGAGEAAGATPIGVKLRALCGKLLSASNASDTGKGHKNCKQCQEVGIH